MRPDGGTGPMPGMIHSALTTWLRADWEVAEDGTGGTGPMPGIIPFSTSSPI